MPSPAISVAGLSKRYHIGALRRRGDLRQWLARAALHPWRRLRSFGRSSHREEDVIWALRDVSFEVQPGEVLGVIGPNGAGKSTLLKILSRITEPTAGRAVLRGRVSSLLEVGTGFHNELTGRENVYLSGAILGMRKAEIDARFDRIVEFAGVGKFIDTPVKRYSSGMRVRLGFAVAAHLEPEILLVDEVLAVGDAAFQRKCLGKMESLERGGRTIIFVSHNMASVKHLCTSCLLLDEGRVVAHGDVNEVVGAYLDVLRPAAAPPGDGCAWDVAPPRPAPDSWPRRVELLDEQGRPLSEVRTGAPMLARISFRCECDCRVSAMLSFNTTDGTPVIVWGTERTGGFHMACSAGDHHVDVLAPSLPLAAGDYVIGAALSVPRVQSLHRVPRVGEVSVAAADVYHTGRPLTSRVCLVVAEHSWRVPEDDRGIERIG